MARRHWPALLTVLALLVFGSYLLYTEKLVREIRAEAAVQTRMYGLVQRGLLSLDESGELQSLMQLQQTFRELRLPMIAINSRGEVYAVVNLPFEADLSTPAGQRRVKEYAGQLALKNPPVLDPGVGSVYFGSPPLIAWLRWVPWLQAGGAVLLLIVTTTILQATARADRERMWAAMARELAHQMGTPLSSLSGWVEVLALAPEERQAFGSPERLAEAIGADVERLERVSRRFELIGKPPMLQQVAPAQLIQELERYLRPRLPRLGAGVEFRVRLRPGLPPLWASPVLLAWALENLVKNALDALAGRGGQIVLSAGRAEEGWVRIVVADDGPGIAADVRDRIFKPGVSTKRTGWGVGLSLTKRIVEELHHGKITVRPRRAGGTIFEILLPTSENVRRRRSRFTGRWTRTRGRWSSIRNRKRR